MSHPDQPSQPPQWGQQPAPGQPMPGYAPQGPPGYGPAPQGPPPAPGQPVHGGPPMPPYPPQGPPGYGGPPPPPRRRKRTWLIPVSVVVALALMATTVWASTSLVNRLFGGPQPETVLPGSSVAFAKLDLKPTGGQWASYAQFYERLPDTVKDELGGSEEDFGETLFEEMFPDLGLDYAGDVEPWLGQRFGVSVWEGTDAEPMFALAIAVEDEGRAEETLTRIQSQEEDFFYVVDGGFALVSDSQAALNDLDAQVADHGTLDRNETFAADIDAIGAGVATAWIDYGALLASAALMDSQTYGSAYDDFEDLGEVTGRGAAVVRVESQYLEFRVDTYGTSVDGAPLFAESVPQGGITALEDLPDDSVIALGGDGLDGLAQAMWEANRDSIESVDGYADFDGVLRELGVRLPADFHKVLGTRTAIGFSDFESNDFFGSSSSDDVSFDLRLSEADQTLWEDVMGASNSGYGPSPTVHSDGDTTVISMGTSGTGRLGDSPVFQQTMRGLEDSHLALYLDLQFFAAESGESWPEQWGGLGGALRFHEGGSSSTVLRWVPSPDA